MLDEWNKGELSSYLIEITRDILKFRDSDNKHLLDKIRDKAGQVGLLSILGAVSVIMYVLFSHLSVICLVPYQLKTVVNS